MNARVASLLLATLAGGMLMLSASPADAQKKGDLTEEPIVDQKDQDINDLVMAYRLIEIGEKNKAPEAIISAASLFRKMSKVKMAPVNEKPGIELDKDAPEGAKALDKVEALPDYEAEANRLFDRASALAAELKLDLEGLITLAKTRKLYRAPVDGPKHVNRLIGAHQNHVYKINVAGKQPLHFGFHSTIPLRISAVRSDNDNTFAAGISNIANATWHPGAGKKGAGVPLTLRISNPSNQPAQYQFLLN